MTKEDKEVLKNCWVMTTDHVLDEENKKLKNVIEKVLEENMTAEEKSRWGYEYFLENHQYNDDLEFNIDILKFWSEQLKGRENANYKYAYAIDRIIKEIER